MTPYGFHASRRPLYCDEVREHLDCLAPFEIDAPVDGFAIHLGFDLACEAPHGTRDIFVGRYDGTHTTFGSIFEIPAENRPATAMAMAALISDGWIEDLVCADLAGDPGPLHLGADACAICFRDAIVIEAGPWPLHPGDDLHFQAMLDRGFHVVIDARLSKHAELEATRQVQAYLTSMIRAASRNRFQAGENIPGYTGRATLVFR